MKFHHLARQNQLVGSRQQRDMSPIKHAQQQQTLSLHRQQQMHHNQMDANTSLTDEEDEDFNNDNQVDIYDSFLAEQQQMQGHPVDASNNGPLNQQQQQQQQGLDSSGFLMDKNKKLFPQKLWELIHNPSIQHCLRWSQDGQRVYLNRNEFETYYLKTPNNQFHTQKAISFVRQMNMYGFRKVDDCYYENDNFRRDRQHLLKNMIRRHPNKGLFVGLDHHQLAAAAAAQQALQVNQQLQQLEHQHKHRAEQALRLNSYLNNHQFHHQSSLARHHHHHPHNLKHSSPFEQMSSQLAQAAVNHLSQQQQQLTQHQLCENSTDNYTAPSNISFDHQNNHNNNNNNRSNNNLSRNAQSSPNSIHNHQPKKSRLLSNFYASAASNNNNNNNNLGANNLATVFADHNHSSNSAAAGANHSSHPTNQMILNQDSMHSTSSVDTQPSQCSSVVNSGSAGSPQPNSPKVLQQQQQLQQRKIRNIQTKESGKFSNSNGPQLQQHVAGTDMTNQSLAARQAALHQTLVRSLLQLKHNQRPQDLLASLQQQHNSRSLLESLASLSSAGTGSIVDPASNSPTERTATPPSGPPSPLLINNKCDYVSEEELAANNNNIALDLAKSSTINHIVNNQFERQHNNHIVDDDDDDDDEDYAINIEEDIDDEDKTADGDGLEANGVDCGDVNGVDSPLDGPKKVKKFLDDHMARKLVDNNREDANNKIKREQIDHDIYDEDDDDHHLLVQRKRIKSMDNNNDIVDASLDSITKSLITEICDRRGDQLNDSALNEAARYTECFLEILLDDASLIAGHSLKIDEKNGECEDEDNKNPTENEIKCKNGVIDISSLSLALKLIPSKLIGAIQQQVTTTRTQTAACSEESN